MNALRKTLLISHGDKGGVGKSYNSMLKVEHLLATGGPVALIESDPTQPDLAQRYAGDPDVTVGALSLNRAGDAENALSSFGAFLESTLPDQVVVNLPAGAGETLDALGGLVRDLADALGYRLVVTYALEKNRIAASALADSLKSGLLAYVEPGNRFVVLPEYKGKSETFEWMHDAARQRFAVPEIIMPALGNRSALQRLEATPGRIARLVDKAGRPDGWMILDQSSVFRWYHAALAALAPVFAGE